MANLPVVSRADAARVVARALLEVDAVGLMPDEPFTYTSGLKAPVYVDCRKLIAYPRIRGTVTELAAAAVARDMGLERFDAVAGGETAGIPYAAWLADRLGLPMQYVRKKAKGFGRNAQIEGPVADGQRTLLVEDLATDGGSKLRFAAALREAGAEVAHCLVVFHHDIFPESVDRLAAEGLAIHALARWSDVLAVAGDSGAFEPSVLAEVERFLAAPLAWSAARGGVDRLDGGS
jgi:orotate phosphoribosyltransferase